MIQLNESKKMVKRNETIDIARGILIILVVIGHYKVDTVHDIIFLFHMPLFFMISGYLIDENKVTSIRYLKSKTTSLMLPYITYLILETIFTKELLGIQKGLKDYFRLLWGGRAIAGVHWFITCFLFSLILFSLMKKNCSNSMVKTLILVGGSIAIVESHLAEYINILKAPGIPLNLDVSLLALVYLGIGFFYKQKISSIVNQKNGKLDLLALVCGVCMVVFCWVNYNVGNGYYYFDMKSVYYKELVSAIVIPSCFLVVLLRISFFISYLNWLNRVKNALIICGRSTVPIMFMHLPLNCLKDTMNYGLGLYVIIGICIPLLLSRIFGNFLILQKLFGFPQLNMIASKYRENASS